LASEFFDMFVEFMAECAAYFVVRANRTRLNKILRRLFQLVDSTHTGLLTRHRVVQLLDEFASRRAGPEVREHLASTGSWPLVDPCLKFEKGEWSGEEATVSEGEEMVKATGDEVEGEVAAGAVDEGEEAVKEVVGVEEKTGVEDVENVGDELRAEAEGKMDGGSVSKSEVKKSVDDEEDDVDASVPVKTVISKDNELCK